jgi:hypothetical protein
LEALGANLLQQRKWEDAEFVLRESLAIREKAEPDSWATHDTRSRLGGAMLGQKKYAEAEPLLIRGYEGLQARKATIPPPDRHRVAEVVEQTIQLYEAWNQPEKAAEWRAKQVSPGEAESKP